MNILSPGIELPFILTRSISSELAHLTCIICLMTEYVVGQLVCYKRGWMEMHIKQISENCKGWHTFKYFRSFRE